MSDDLPGLNEKTFHTLKHFADLRVVCTSWNCAIVPILYQSIILFTTLFTSLQRCVTAFEHAADHIRSVVIYEFRGQSLMQDLVERILDRCLSMCTNLRRLECYGSHHTFTSPEWLSTIVPQLATTVTHLIIEADDADISNSLASLGPSLKTLQLRRCIGNTQLSADVFPLPPAFPRLSQITIINGPNVWILEKVFAGIVEVNPDNQKWSPLRKLSFVIVHGLNTSNILRLIKINYIGSHLTSVSIELYDYLAGSAFLVQVIKACPMLEEFSYTLPTHKEIFDHLQPPVQHLHLLVDRTSSDPCVINSPDDFLPYIRKNAAHSLHTLTVVAEWCSLALGERIDGTGPLKFACDDLGILLNYSRRGAFDDMYAL